MTDFISAFCVGLVETSIGHPFDTAKILMQNNKKWLGLSLRQYYKGWKFPLLNSLIFNCTIFPIYERTLPYTNSHIISGAISGVAVSPIVFINEVGKITLQTNQTLQIASFRNFNGYTSTMGRETLAMATYFSVYKYGKNNLHLSPLFAGAFSGIVNWTLTYPFDIIKSRQIAQKISISEAIKQGNLWRGYSVCIIRAGLVNPMNFWTYEKVKYLLSGEKTM